MAALLKGGSRRGYRLRDGLSLYMGYDAPGSKLGLRDRHEGTLFPLEKTANSLLHTGFVNLSCEATSNVHDIGNRIPVGFVFKLSVTGSRPEKKVYRVTWFGARGRSTVWRCFSSLEAFPSSILDATSSTESTESESENVKDFDFRNFPALTSSFFENYERPIEMEVRRKRGVWKHLDYAEKKLTLDSIPKPRGRTYDFGLGDVAAKPPPLEAGARPQGGFDIDISFNECEVDALPQRQSPLGNLPSEIGESDKLSEITKGSCIIKDMELQITEGRDFQVIEDGEFQTSVDKVLDHEQDFLWDPYNVDEA